MSDKPDIFAEAAADMGSWQEIAAFWQEQAKQFTVQNETLIRERDYLRDENRKLWAKVSEYETRSKEVAAYERGYRRGVQDAAKVAKNEWSHEYIAEAIIALLEQTSEPGAMK